MDCSGDSSARPDAKQSNRHQRLADDSVRTCVVIPKHMMHMIDGTASKMRCTRSAMIRTVLMENIGRYS